MMMSTTKPILIRFLVCANLAILVFGLLIIKNSQSTSHHDKPQDIFDTSPTLQNEDQAWYSSDKDIEANEQGTRGGFLSHVWGSLWKSVNNMKEEPLCEFKGDIKGIQRNMLVKKFVECYKEMSSKKSAIRRDEYYGLESKIQNRRLLRGITTSIKVLEGSSYGASKVVDEATKGTPITSRSNVSQAADNKIEAAFHIDYSGPKTHPPKNN